MALRTVLLAVCAGLAPGACASGPSLEERAQTICTAEGHPAGPEMDRCVIQTVEALHRARELPTPPPARPPGQR
jgi:hypothetical protein